MTNQHIFLVGPMGVGKTTIGKRQLSSLLERPFIDIDKEIEARSGADIQWIFDREGEQGFRERESRVFEDIITANDRSVIATGGGIVLRAINRNFLREYGQCVYLSASKEQLYERTLGINRGRFYRLRIASRLLVTYSRSVILYIERLLTLYLRQTVGRLTKWQKDC